MTFSERLARRDPAVQEIRLEETGEVIGHLRTDELPENGAVAPVINLAGRRGSSGTPAGAA